MKVIEGDLWEELLKGNHDAVLIPTNGFVKKDGMAIMGAGVAKQACERYPGIARKLGTFLQHNMKMDDPQWSEPWNVPYKIGTTESGTGIFSFPTKPSYVYPKDHNEHIMGRFHKDIGDQKRLPGWMAKSDLALINRSAKLISEVCVGFKSIILPVVGTGHGELKTVDVKPLLEKYFDDRYMVVVQ